MYLQGVFVKIGDFIKFKGFLGEFLESRRSWENQKPPENRQKSGLFWASPFTMHLVCTLKFWRPPKQEDLTKTGKNEDRTFKPQKEGLWSSNPGNRREWQKGGCHSVRQKHTVSPPEEFSKRCFLNGVFQSGVFRGAVRIRKGRRHQNAWNQWCFQAFLIPPKRIASVASRGQKKKSEKTPFGKHRLEPFPVLLFLGLFENTKENLKNTKDFLTVRTLKNPVKYARNTQKHQGNS